MILPHVKIWPCHPRPAIPLQLASPIRHQPCPFGWADTSSPWPPSPARRRGPKRLWGTPPRPRQSTSGGRPLWNPHFENSSFSPLSPNLGGKLEAGGHPQSRRRRPSPPWHPRRLHSAARAYAILYCHRKVKVTEVPFRGLRGCPPEILFPPHLTPKRGS